MADPDSRDDPPHVPSRARLLIGEYHRQQESWRNQTVELTRLRSELLAAGEQDAANVVNTARVAIRRVLVDARRELLELATQIEAIEDIHQRTEVDGDRRLPNRAAVDDRPGATISSAADELESRDRILAARRDLSHVVAETRAALDRLHRDALAFHVNAQHKAEDTEPVLATIDQHRPVSDQVARLEPPSRWARRRIAWTAIVAVAGSAIVWGSADWYRHAAVDARSAANAVSNLARLRPGTAATPDVESSSQPTIEGKASATTWPLLVQARRPAWIQATIDGRVESGRLFQAGETRRVTGAREVSLRVGDAGAVFVSTAGRELAALGRDGEVVTRRFTANAPAGPTDPRGFATASPVGTLGPAPDEERSRQDPAHTAMGEKPPGSVAARAAATAPGIAATAIPTASARETATPPASQVSDPSRDLADAAQRWLEAYYRHDLATMGLHATPDITVSDDRKSNERPPAGLGQLRLLLEHVSCQVVGDSAVLAGRMTEQTPVGNDFVRYVSWISQTWLRTADQWRLMDVRIVSESKLQKR